MEQESDIFAVSVDVYSLFSNILLKENIAICANTYMENN